jgi:hypothetical protein
MSSNVQSKLQCVASKDICCHHCRVTTCKMLLQVLVWSNACEDGLCTVPEDCQHRQTAYSRASNL